MPERIQLRRTRGWRKPEGAVVVSRPSKWGNPYKVGGQDSDGQPIATVEESVAAYRRAADWYLAAYARRELAGRDLACWCPLVDADGNPAPCHADVLLEISNSMPVGGDRP